MVIREKPRAHTSANPRQTRIEYRPMRARSLLISAAFVAAACSAPPPTGKALVNDAIAAMGGDKLKSAQMISMKSGTGTRTRLQEQRHVTDAEDTATLKNVIEIVDVAGGRA